jgi:hypothetical protein
VAVATAAPLFSEHPRRLLGEVPMRHLATTILGLSLPMLVFTLEPTNRLQSAQPPSVGEVRVVPSSGTSSTGETTYEVRSESCRIRWTIARTGINGGIAQHRAGCGLPLSDQLRFDARILDAVMEREPAFRSLYLGRLRQFPELSRRLAAAAQQSSGWDAARGEPSDDTPTPAYLMRLLSSTGKDVFAEWRQLFESRGLRFAVSGLEDVQVARGTDIPGYKPTVDSNDRLPFDALVWFSVIRSN